MRYVYKDRYNSLIARVGKGVYRLTERLAGIKKDRMDTPVCQVKLSKAEKEDLDLSLLLAPVISEMLKQYMALLDKKGWANKCNPPSDPSEYPFAKGVYLKVLKDMWEDAGDDKECLWMDLVNLMIYSFDLDGPYDAMEYSHPVSREERAINRTRHKLGRLLFAYHFESFWV